MGDESDDDGGVGRYRGFDVYDGEVLVDMMVKML